MKQCPFCGRELKTRETKGWRCECDESIPFGLEYCNEKRCTSSAEDNR